MGSAPSTLYHDQKVVFPPSYYIPTINKRFVKDRPVTLVLQDQFWTQPRDHDFVIRDSKTNQIIFRIGPISEADSIEQHRRRLLLDAYGVPVVGMERHDRPPVQAQYTVIPGGTSSKTALCNVITHMIGMYEPPFLLGFTDPASGKPMILSAKGNWQSRDAVITITTDSRRNDALYCIARIYFDKSPLDGEYFMDVAAGVDLSLIMLLAAMMEEQTKKHMSKADRTALRHTIKGAAAQKRPEPQQPPKKQSNGGILTKPRSAAA